jgi:UDP-N-acetylglucosamine acyltransferase
MSLSYLPGNPGKLGLAGNRARKLLWHCPAFFPYRRARYVRNGLDWDVAAVPSGCESWPPRETEFAAFPGTEAAMSISASARIHPTALVSAEAELADNVEIGAYAILEGKVCLDRDCVVRPHAMLCGPVTMGRGNIVYSGAILGERPQHLRYNNEPTWLEIGEGNTFREGVTVHRGTTHSWATRVGNNNYFMANSHIGHDSTVGNNCIFANGALVGGHCHIGDSVYLSGNSAVHQFIRIGRLAMLSGCSATTKDVPPFIIQQNVNIVMGVNVVGMRRAGCTPAQVHAVHKAFKIIFREGLVMPSALAKMEQDMGGVDVIQEMIAFIRQCPKGINSMRVQAHDEAA